MRQRRYNHSHTSCPRCDFGPFTRNHYFNGKLLVERDFTDEQRYAIEKLRHHHQRLHGWGVVCGLEVKQHENPDCQDRFVYVEPGTAIDCCGHEILVREKECIDITKFGKVKELIEKDKGDIYTLQLCISYKECPTEEIPVLYDECGCDDTQCAPNRILESYEFDIVVDPDDIDEKHPCEDGTADTILSEEDCENILNSSHDCPKCDTGNCVVLATIDNYAVGDKIVDKAKGENLNEDEAGIDNLTHRCLLPSTRVLTETLKCILEKGTNGPGVPGPQGPPGADGSKWYDGIVSPSPATGVDSDYYLDTVTGDVYEKQSGSWSMIGNIKGPKGEDGEDGEGLEEDLTRIKALSWIHREEITLDLLDKFILNIKRINQEEPVTPGIVIGFDNNVHVANGKSPIDARHVFQVYFPVRLKSGFNEELYLHKQFNDIFNCSCPILGKVIPVDFEPDDAEKIDEAWEVDESIARGVAFIFEEKFFREYKYEDFRDFLKEYVSQFSENDKLDIWVRLRGEFVIDEKDRAIDAEFARGELPTGNRPSGSKFGVQGGLFESWFTIKLKEDDKKISVNTASAREIAEKLPYIGNELAKLIVKRRDDEPFKKIEDLLEVSGIGESILAKIRDLIIID